MIGHITVLPAMKDDDLLLDASQAYLIGAFNNAIKLLQKIKSVDPVIRKKIDGLTYDIYIAQKKYTIVLDEIPVDSEIVEFKLQRLLAEYLSSPEKKPEILLAIDGILAGSFSVDDEGSLVLAARTFMNANMHDAALKVLHNGNSLMCTALTAQCFMAMHRYDLAGKIVRRMQATDEDSLPAQLITALYYLTKGGEQLQEALTIYDELCERFGSCSTLVNGRAAALIAMNRWDEAETALHEALDFDGSNPEVLMNLIMVSHHLGKPMETINRLTSQLKDSDKEHPFLYEMALKDDEFTRCSQQYAPAVAE